MVAPALVIHHLGERFQAPVGIVLWPQAFLVGAILLTPNGGHKTPQRGFLPIEAATEISPQTRAVEVRDFIRVRALQQDRDQAEVLAILGAMRAVNGLGKQRPDFLFVPRPLAFRAETD